VLLVQFKNQVKIRRQSLPKIGVSGWTLHNYRINRVIAETAKIPEVFLLDHWLDDIFRRDGRNDGSQPPHVALPDGFVAAQRQDLKNSGGDAAEVDEGLDGVGRFRNQSLPALVVDA
jgi:hypothetical protein